MPRMTKTCAPVQRKKPHRDLYPNQAFLVKDKQGIWAYTHTFCFPISISSTEPPNCLISAAATSIIFLISPLFSGHADTLWMATHSASFCLWTISKKGFSKDTPKGRKASILLPCFRHPTLTCYLWPLHVEHVDHTWKNRSINRYPTFTDPVARTI